MKELERDLEGVAGRLWEGSEWIVGSNLLSLGVGGWEVSPKKVSNCGAFFCILGTQVASDLVIKNRALP